MKFAMCIWLPSSLHACSKMYHKKGIKAYAAPLVLYAIGVALVMGGRDLGTAMILVFIGGVAFLIVGFPGKWMGVGVLGAVVMVGALAVSSPNRLRRILATYGDCSAADAQSVCYQSIHAKYAIASGGFLGLGIGNSREKWNYLPAAHNDFIFAIIGEETGFVGCAIVLLFFCDSRLVHDRHRIAGHRSLCCHGADVRRHLDRGPGPWSTSAWSWVCSRYWACLCRSSPQVAHP